MFAETASPALPGFSGFHADSRAPIAAVAVNVDTAGSDAKVLAADELTAAFAGLPVRVVPADRSVAAAVTGLRIGRELWQGLVFSSISPFASWAFLAPWLSRADAETRCREESNLG